MIRFFTFLYSCLIIHFASFGSYMGIAYTLLCALFTILVFIEIKKYSISHCEKLIKAAQENNQIKPFINPNKAPFYILELLPGLNKTSALKITNRNKRKIKFKNFIEFANFCGLDLPYYKVCKIILKF